MTSDVWPFYLSIALFSMGDRGYLTSMQSIIPSLVPTQCAVRANAASYMMMQSGSFVGALLAGAFLHTLPYAVLFTTTATIFLVSAMAIGRLRLSHSGSSASAGVDDRRLKHVLAIAQLRDNKLLLPAFYYSLAFAVGVLMNVLMSSYVANELKGDSTLFGKTESAWALGSIMVCFILLAGFANLVPGQDLVAPLFVSGLTLIWLGMLPEPGSVLLAVVVLGASCNLSRVFIDVRIQQTVELTSTGRARGAIHMLALGAGLAVYALVGLVDDTWPASYLFLGSGMLVVLSGIGGLLHHKLGSPTRVGRKRHKQ